MRRWLPQIVRKLAQLSVVAFVVYAALGGAWRNYKVAHNQARLVGLMKGDLWGWLYGTNEDALSLLGEPYQASLSFLGFPWAGRLFGLDLTDPILVAANLLETGGSSWALLLGLAVPLGLALLFGKIFCSHLCPMRLLFELANAVRAGLMRLGFPLPELRSDTRLGGWILVGGLVATLGSSSAIWLFILPYASLSASIHLLITTGALTALAVVVLGWFVVDLFAAPGFFCHNLCPTGFLLEQVGRPSLLKLRKNGDEPCPESCNVCQRSCPYGLLPKERSHMPACDNCGRCASSCPTRRLGRRLLLPVIGALALCLLPSGAQAHHNKGLPHYGYFENYPQVPTEEYVTIQGRWEVGATIFNFQGYDARHTSDTPNDVKIYLYLYDLEADEGYSGPLDVEIRRDGELVSRFDRVAVDEESVYSTRETLPGSGTYQLVAFAQGAEVIVPFHVDMDDGVSWWLVGGIAFPVLLLFWLAIIGRRRRLVAGPAGGRSRVERTAALLLLAGSLLVPASTDAQPHAHGPELLASADERAGQGEICPHCGMVDCTMQHVADESGQQIMVMGGIPGWLFMVGIAAILILSFVATEWIAPRARDGFRLNLVRSRRVYAMVRSRWFQAVPQLLMAAVLGLLIFAGLFGSSIANITPVAVWTIWWAALILAVLLLGSVWCFICPWDGLANLMSRLRLAARVEPLSLGASFPPWLRNMYPAIGAFVLLTWLELGWGVTTDPRATAYMGLAMGGAAVGAALLWDGKRFCAHLCPVGRICGIYGNFSPIEVRAKKPRTCQSCRTEDCLNGNERGYPCPTGISLKTVQSATMCTMCTECVKSCDKQNVAINLRPFGTDLREIRTPRLDEAWLAVTLLTLTLFHGLSMTPVWESFDPGGTSILKWLGTHLGLGHTASFSVAMAGASAIPIGLYWASCRVAAWWAQEGVSTRKLFLHYAYSLLPIALFYHVAHNLMHLLMEGGEIVPLLSDPLGDGSDLLGTAGVRTGHLIGEQPLWYIQVGLILIGHIVGIVVAHRIGHRLYASRKAAMRSLLPMLVIMVLLSAAGLGLMHLDMNMRVGRM